jgi:hypothetical protein
LSGEVIGIRYFRRRAAKRCRDRHGEDEQREEQGDRGGGLQQASTDTAASE